jgi:transcription antitermination factor NusG
VDHHLRDRGFTSFLPLVSQVQRWSDRRKLVQFPLFPGYTFVRIKPTPEQRVRILQVNGVVGFVGAGRQGSPISEAQIEGIRTLVSSNVPFSTRQFLKAGQRVRIRGGALHGLEGILVAQNGDASLVLSIEPIQRSLSISIAGYEVEPV